TRPPGFWSQLHGGLGAIALAAGVGLFFAGMTYGTKLPLDNTDAGLMGGGAALIAFGIVLLVSRAKLAAAAQHWHTPSTDTPRAPMTPSSRAEIEQTGPWQA